MFLYVFMEYPRVLECFYRVSVGFWSVSSVVGGHLRVWLGVLLEF